MKKISIIKIVCVLALLLGVHQCTSYKELAPHIFLVKENTSFLNQTLTMGQPLVVEGQRGSQYYGYIYVNGEKKEGYISSRNVIAYVFDESFEKEITSFPDSYKQSLRFLHVLYPEWNYVPLSTSLDFNDTASIFQSKSLIDTNDSSMIASPDIIEGQTWRRVSLNASRYFLDPRNGLDAYHALMFEKLTYNPSETLQEGKRMLEGTEMSGIEPQSKKDWAELYRHSAEVNNISMSLLITRAIQEQTGGGLGLRGGHARNNPQGPLFYNIYNIGAKTDGEIQKYVLEKNQYRQSHNLFSVEVVYWEEISAFLKSDARILQRYYPFINTDGIQDQFDIAYSSLDIIRHDFVELILRYKILDFLLEDPFVGIKTEYLILSDKFDIALKDLLQRTVFLQETELYQKIIAFCGKWNKYNGYIGLKVQPSNNGQYVRMNQVLMEDYEEIEAIVQRMKSEICEIYESISQ